MMRDTILKWLLVIAVIVVVLGFLRWFWWTIPLGFLIFWGRQKYLAYRMKKELMNDDMTVIDAEYTERSAEDDH